MEAALTIAEFPIASISTLVCILAAWRHKNGSPANPHILGFVSMAALVQSLEPLVCIVPGDPGRYIVRGHTWAVQEWCRGQDGRRLCLHTARAASAASDSNVASVSQSKRRLHASDMIFKESQMRLALHKMGTDSENQLNCKSQTLSSSQLGSSSSLPTPQ